MWAVSASFMWLKVLVPLQPGKCLEQMEISILWLPLLPSLFVAPSRPGLHCRTSLKILTQGPCPAFWPVVLLLMAKQRAPSVALGMENQGMYDKGRLRALIVSWRIRVEH